MTPMRLFISYSHEDESLIEEFRCHIAPLLNKGLISDWYDGKIKLGEVLSDEIENNMQNSDIICLFISARFLGSNECNKEKEKALKLRQEKNINVIPIILFPCAWKDDPSISGLKASPKDGKPIIKFSLRDDAWLNVYEDLKKVIKTYNENIKTITRYESSGNITKKFHVSVQQEFITNYLLNNVREKFKGVQEKLKISWTDYPNSRFLALAVLIGAWSDNNQHDRKVIPKLLGNKASYDEWYDKAREILNRSDSPLSLKDDIWEVHNRAELWKQIGSYITSNDLDIFKELAISILKEPDPAFELPAEKRLAANVYGKVPKYSPQLRKGIAEGLAILGSMPDSCNRHCSQEKVEGTCIWAVREILSDADWVRWGSLNDLLPALAEAAPDEFLSSVKETLNLTSCPFDELFAQEGDGITGSNYLTGLLWALEVLAWNKQYLVRTCVVLGELASHDPSGRWSNRPFNSLATILLPWFPQTEDASKCRVAVETLLKEYPDIAWNLIIQFLPNQRNSSFGSFKPKWRETIPDNQGKNVTNKEYWEQVSFYAELAIDNARNDDASDNIDRLVILIDNFDKLPQLAFDKLVDALSSDTITTFSKEQQKRLWEHLTKLINTHRRFSTAKWALSDKHITRVEKIAKRLTPTEAFNRYQYLFNNYDFDLYEENDNHDEQQKKIEEKRETAILEIFQQNDIEDVISFAESVAFPEQVGLALGAISDKSFEQTLMPEYLDTSNKKHKALASGFIRRRHNDKGWQWCDNIDRSDWTPAQTGQFLACLPFAKETWNRATEWLQEHEAEYWSRTEVNDETNDDITSAIEKLIKHGRPQAVIQCLNTMHNTKQQISANQCVQALLAVLSSKEPTSSIDKYSIVELIKFLQTESSVNSDDLFRVEWEYLCSSNSYEFMPQCLENRLTKNPEFFCKVIRLVSPSKNKDQSLKKPTKESRAIKENVWRLLYAWKTLPGIQDDGIFNAELFTRWLQRVKELCKESSHLDVALISIGEILIHAPPDPDGLWIHRAVATALNEDNPETDSMRHGFHIATLNSCGIYTDEDLARQFRDKAEEVENAGFHRLADILQRIAKHYDREAKRIIRESENITK